MLSGLFLYVGTHGSCLLEFVFSSPLAAPLAAAGYLGAVAPFGDVYLTALEFLARARSRAGSAQMGRGSSGSS